MAIEIERKFLLATEEWRNQINKQTIIKQGYLNSHPERTTRIRIKGEKGFFTVKGKSNGNSRLEFEYEIPLSDAEVLLQLCEKPIIEKTRFEIYLDNHTWEIDEFEGENKGLVVAEIELQSEDELFTKPNWLGKEVSDQSKYFNSSLIKNPFSRW